MLQYLEIRGDELAAFADGARDRRGDNGEAAGGDVIEPREAGSVDCRRAKSSAEAGDNARPWRCGTLYVGPATESQDDGLPPSPSS
jgi:hypothetical protein